MDANFNNVLMSNIGMSSLFSIIFIIFISPRFGYVKKDKTYYFIVKVFFANILFAVVFTFFMNR